MNELENARLAKMVTRIVCCGVIAFSVSSLWGTAAAWLALAVATLITVGFTGVEQEVRRFSDALIRAEKRVTGETP